MNDLVRGPALRAPALRGQSELLPIAKVLADQRVILGLQVQTADIQRERFSTPRLYSACAGKRHLVELAVKEPRPDETFWLVWKPEHMGEALKWWRQRLDRPLWPGILPY